jgi:arylsulfatase A-like enzyme
MNRRDFIKTSSLAAMSSAVSYPANARGTARGDAPNILFVHVDQMSILDSIRAYGCEHTLTPGIDRLIENGTSFMQTYQADPVCCPARASWWTGAHSSEHGTVVNGVPCHRDMPDLSRMLQNAGYNTYYTGKWHVPGKSARNLFNLLHEGSWWGELTDADVTRTAETFLHNYNRSEPFFLSVGYLNPHDICITPWYDEERASLVGGIKVPPYLKEGVLKDGDLPPLPAGQDYDKREPAIMVVEKRDGSIENPKYSNWNDELWRMHRYNYHRFTEMVDHQIDQLLDSLEQSAFRDNTLIVFASDHGEGMGRHKTVWKSTFYDEVCRTPFVIASLGDLKVRKNMRDSKHLVSGLDFGRTVCDYAEADGSALRHGRSLRPLVEGREVPWREYVYAENSIYMHMVTDGTIKYIREYIENDVITGIPPLAKTHRTGVEQLFNLANDPDEVVNLAYDPAYRSTLDRMRAALDREEEKLKVRPVPKRGLDFMQSRANAIKRLNLPQSY